MLIYNSTFSENYLGVPSSLSQEVSYVGHMFAQMCSKYLEMCYLFADDLLI